MRKKQFLLLSLFIAALLMQSCFEIRETLKINKDGSGSFILSIDLSQVKLMLEGFGGGDDSENTSPFENMEEEYESTRAELELIEGISNISFTSEMDGYIIRSSFDFSSIDALNRGMDVVYDNASEDGDVPEYYKMSKKSFERTANHNFLEMVKEELGTEEMQVEGLDLASLFSEVAYINEITFNGKTIKKVKSGLAVVSEDQSSVSNKYFIFKTDIDQSLEFALKIK